MVPRGLRLFCCLGMLGAAAAVGGVSVAQEVLPEVHIGAPAGTNRYWTNTWGILGVDMTNPGDQPAKIQAITHFEENPSQQFGRTFWVPPQAVRHDWCSFLVPMMRLKVGQTSVDIRTTAWEVSTSERKPIRPPKMGTEDIESSPLVRPLLEQLNSQQNITTVALPIGQENTVTGLIVDTTSIRPAPVREWEDDSGAPIDFGYAATLAMQFVLSSDRSVQLLEGSLLPPTGESLEGLDRLVIQDNRLLEDTAAATAVRNWLHQGGRVWIMLDQVDEATVGLLLGDALDLEVVERVGVTSVRLTGPDGKLVGRERGYPAAVPLVRVLTPGIEPIHTIDGWPASFWVRMGRGRVLITTLGARAWLNDGAGETRARSADNEQIQFSATDALKDLAGDFLQRPSRADASALEPLLTKQIGYEVVARGKVFLVLGGFCLLLPVAGVWLQRRARMERLSWIAPGLALLAAGALLGFAALSRRSIEPTVASVQLVEAVAGSGNVSVTGTLGIYNHAESQGRLAAQRGGTYVPDLADSGVTRCMTWTGLDEWHWENLSLPAGVRRAPFRVSLNTPHPVEARGQFGPQGLALSVTPGLFQNLGDAVVVTGERQRLACRPTGDSQFVVGPQDLLLRDQFLADTLLTDQQEQRQEIYRSFFGSNEIAEFESQLRLVAWADGLDTGFEFPRDVRQVGASLITLALRFNRTPPGTDVVIPSAFLAPRSVAGPGVSSPSSLFNNRTGQWVDGERDAQVWLRFQLPQEVLPITLQRATLTLSGQARTWRLELSQLMGGTPAPLTVRDDLAEKLEVAIPADGLRTDPDGALTIGIKITSRGAAEPPQPWSIDYVRLDVSGRTATE